MSSRRARPRAIPVDPDRYSPCVRCGTSYARAVRWPEGRVCHYCATAARLREGYCAACGHNGIVPGLDPSGAPICVACSGIPVNVSCRSCGSEAPLGRSARCWRCLLTTRVQDLLAGPEGTIATPLRPLAAAITAMPRANSGHAWLANPDVAQLLRQLASGQVPLEHAALDELPDSRTVEHLRGLLVAEDCLPPRDPHLARFERWLAAKLDTIERAEDRQLVDRFARWHLLRRLRDQAQQGPISDGAFLNAKQTTTVTIGFLDWLHQRTATLAELSQHDIDAWFATGPTTRKHAVRFLYWARDQRIIDHLEVPIPRTRQADPLGPGQRLAHLHRVLTDQTIQPAPRLLAALVLLFGASLGQLVALTLDDVVEDETGTRLRLGTEPVLLPQPLVDLLRALLDDPRYRRNTVTNRHSRWLFPGTRPGKPIHLYTARTMLQDIGIPSRSARAGTWLQLVREAPPAVLADALGLSATAAMRYAALAGADFLSYKPAPRPAPNPEARD